MKFNYSEINELEIKGYCMIRNFINVSNFDQEIENLEKELIDISGNEEDNERFKKAGYPKFGCVDFSNPLIFKFLDYKLIEDLNKLTGNSIYFKRIPFYKKLTSPKGKDIVYEWHNDGQKLYSLLFYLTDVNESTPHTQIYDKLNFFNSFLPLKDPRNSLIGKLYLILTKIFKGKPYSCFGKRGDLLIINNGENLHRAYYDKSLKNNINQRINLHIALTPKKITPYKNEKIKNFSALTQRLDHLNSKNKETVIESLKLIKD